jgi:hypothetical protein
VLRDVLHAHGARGDDGAVVGFAQRLGLSRLNRVSH